MEPLFPGVVGFLRYCFVLIFSEELKRPNPDFTVPETVKMVSTLNMR